jgi:nucleoside-diphosphate-sugar epimerase
MKILIIGGTGFTGPFTVNELVNLGHDVVLYHRGSTKHDLPSSVRHIFGDKNDLPKFASELQQLKPDVVVHMMANTKYEAHTFLETFRGHCGRAVVVSSIDVYRAFGRIYGTEPGYPDPVPLNEDAPLRTRLSPSGESYDKLGVENVLSNAVGLATTVLRFPVVYGPNAQFDRSQTFLKRMEDGRPAIIFDDTAAQILFSHGYVENVAHATTLAITNDKAAGRIYNVADAGLPPWAEWIGKIGQIAGWPGQVVIKPRAELPNELRGIYYGYSDTDQHWQVDTSRIRKELNYEELVPQDEALRRTVLWHRSRQSENPALDYTVEDAVLAVK